MLSLEGVRDRRADGGALDSVSVTLFSGAIVQVLGGGSESLLKILALYKKMQYSGRILYNGHDIKSAPEVYRTQICYVSKTDGLSKDLTLRQNIKFLAKLHGCVEKVDFILEAFEMQDFAEKTVRDLSLNIRYRAWLSRILMTSAPVWLIENLFEGIDREFIDVLSLIIESRRQQRGIVLYSAEVDQSEYLNDVTDLVV